MPWVKTAPSEPGTYRVLLDGFERPVTVPLAKIEANVLWPNDWSWWSADGLTPTRIEEPPQEPRVDYYPPGTYEWTDKGARLIEPPPPGEGT